MKKIKIAAVTGPTASGKTALAIALAKRLDGEIISCDSMQIYRGMDIGTAKPTKAELAEVPHHLIDVLPADAPYSCSDYVKDAERAVQDISSRGKLPIFCGGTGLYLDRFLKGGNDDSAACDEGLREELKAFANEKGVDALYERLVVLDPEAAATIHKNNVKRVIRALEIYDLTGKPKSYFDELSRSSRGEVEVGMITLDFHNRDNLYKRVDERVDLMIEEGLVDEVRELYSSGILKKDTTAAAAIGYKEVIGYLDGEMSLEQTVELIKLSTRRYAKRQLTWFRHERDALRLYIDTEDGVMKSHSELLNETINLAQEIINKRGNKNET